MIQTCRIWVLTKQSLQGFNCWRTKIFVHSTYDFLLLLLSLPPAVLVSIARLTTTGTDKCIGGETLPYVHVVLYWSNFRGRRLSDILKGAATRLIEVLNFCVSSACTRFLRVRAVNERRNLICDPTILCGALSNIHCYKEVLILIRILYCEISSEYLSSSVSQNFI